MHPPWPMYLWDIEVPLFDTYTIMYIHTYMYTYYVCVLYDTQCIPYFYVPLFSRVSLNPYTQHLTYFVPNNDATYIQKYIYIHTYVHDNKNILLYNVYSWLYISLCIALALLGAGVGLNGTKQAF